jgi:HEPN domain-containing protein
MNEHNLDVNKWIHFALMDFDLAAKVAKDYYPAPIEIICYHCQQAAEKILKAYTLANGNPLKKTHDLNVLANDCKQFFTEFDKLQKSCLSLTKYEIISRYPPLVDLTETDMKQALKDTRQILDFTIPKLTEMGYECKSE